MDNTSYFVRISREDLERTARQMGIEPPFPSGDRSLSERLRRLWSSQLRRLETWQDAANSSPRPRRITLPSEQVRRIRMETETEDWESSARCMLELINRDRARYPEECSHGRPLQWHDGVAQVARQHSLDMLRRNFMDHVNPDGKTPFDRLRAARILFLCAGENVGSVTAIGGIASIRTSLEQIQLGFMNEPPNQQNHRGNILNPSFTHVGVGIAYDGQGRLAATQNFIQGWL